ncbi:MAG: hypothetical protein P8163_08310 [Candidatus Thiodiazotropha sp.]
MSDQDQALVNKLKAQEKTIRILSERLEKHITDNLSGFALFEQNITLENVVTMRTRELEAKRVELQQTLNDLKTAQAELLQAQKLQAIGQLASGVAHEINTPNQFVSNNISFLADSFGDLLQAIDSCEKLTTEVSDGEAVQSLSSALADVLEEADLNDFSQGLEFRKNGCVLEYVNQSKIK